MHARYHHGGTLDGCLTCTPLAESYLTIGRWSASVVRFEVRADQREQCKTPNTKNGHAVAQLSCSMARALSASMT